MRPSTAALALAGATALIPLAPAEAQPLPSTVSVHEKALLPPQAGPHNPGAQVRAVRRDIARDRAVRPTLRLARRAARVTGDRLPRGYRLRLARESRAELADRRAKLRREIRAARRVRAAQRAAAATGAPSGALAAIAACESGSNPGAVDPSGTYHGKYQFDQATWQSVGGSGTPSAAPEAEQDARAAMLYARAGASPWPVCGR